MKKHAAMLSGLLKASVIILACIGFLAPLGRASAAGLQPAKELSILAGTFPLYLFTRNVVGGVEGVKVDIMIPPGMGCPHDYALTPADMEKIRHSDLFIANGLGLEEFLGTPMLRANPGVVVVDTSKGITNLIDVTPTASTEDHGHKHGPLKEAASREKATHQPAEAHHAEHREHGHDDHAGKEDDHHEHMHSGPNPHLFASPSMAAKIVQNIAEALAQADPVHTEDYRRNASAYAASLTSLAAEFAAAGQKLRSRKIVTQHAVFDYLARDMGLEIVAVVAENPGQEPSAAEMLRIIKTIRQQGAAAIFTEPQYPAKVGQTIAEEAGIPVAGMDPVATGPDKAPLDYYEQVMRKNLETLEKTLGYQTN